MASEGPTESEKADSGEEKLNDLLFVFDQIQSRQEWENHVQRYGGSVERKVSPSTDYFVVPDDPEEADIGPADEHNVPTVTMSEFGALLLERGVSL